MESRNPEHGVPLQPNLGSCARWSCTHRQAVWGADALLVTRLVAGTVQDTIATIIAEREVQQSPRPVEAYVSEFYEEFWARVWDWLEPPIAKPLLDRFAAHGALCVTNFAVRMLPRMLPRERYLGHQFPYMWTLPTGQSEPVTFVGTLGRAAEDLETGAIRLYTWHIEPADSETLALFRSRRAGIPIGWGQEYYPDREIVLRETYLPSDVIREVAPSPQEMRMLRLMLVAQALDADRIRASHRSAFPIDAWN
jgi:hypothetical protein